ncbi:hypothetical protein ACWGJP_04780 [Microbacterium sp. NPDC055903]
MSTVDDFLARLSSADQDSAWTARELLATGWVVRDVLGPVQMDVWQLLLRGGECDVRFGMERGYSDGVHVADEAGEYRPVTRMMSAEDPSASVDTAPTDVLGWLIERAGRPRS